jgi:tetratricopeptide (TPR) repeat protein
MVPGLLRVRCLHLVAVRLLAVLALGAILELSGRSALAAENDKAVARAHYETATRLYEVREYADALREYKAAYVAKPDVAFLFNIGQCYRKMGKNTDALDFFQQFLKKALPDDPNRGLVEALVRNIESGAASDSDPFDSTPVASPPPPVVPVQRVPLLPSQLDRPSERMSGPAIGSLPTSTSPLAETRHARRRVATVI